MDTMETVVDGYRIQYKVFGDGERTAVILQGWGTTLEVYDSVASCLAVKFRVITLNLPGFGTSDEPKKPWAVEDYAQFVISFFAQMNITSAVLLGHSYGGRIIIRLAAKDELPFNIEQIVLIDSAGIVPEKSFKQKFKIRRYKILKKIVSLKLVHAICPDIIDEWKNRQGSADYRNATPIMRQCLVKAVNEDLRELMPRIKVDTLLVWGDGDTATPLKDGQMMEKLIPGSGLATIKGAGHYSFLDQPGVFMSIMNAYFKLGEQ